MARRRDEEEDWGGDARPGRLREDRWAEEDALKAAFGVNRTRRSGGGRSGRIRGGSGRVQVPTSGRIGRDAQGRQTRTAHIHHTPVHVGTDIAHTVDYALREGQHEDRVSPRTGEPIGKADLEATAGDRKRLEKVIAAVDAAALKRRGRTAEKIAVKIVIELPVDSSREGRQRMADAVVAHYWARGYEAVAGVHGRTVQPHLHAVVAARPVAADGTVDRTPSRVLLRGGKAELRAERHRLAELVNVTLGQLVRFWGGRDAELAEPGIVGRAPKRRVPMPRYVREQDEIDPAAAEERRARAERERAEAKVRAETRAAEKARKAAERTRRAAAQAGLQVVEKSRELSAVSGQDRSAQAAALEAKPATRKQWRALMTLVAEGQVEMPADDAPMTAAEAGRMIREGRQRPRQAPEPDPEPSRPAEASGGPVAVVIREVDPLERQRITGELEAAAGMAPLLDGAGPSGARAVVFPAAADRTALADHVEVEALHDLGAAPLEPWARRLAKHAGGAVETRGSLLAPGHPKTSGQTEESRAEDLRELWTRRQVQGQVRSAAPPPATPRARPEDSEAQRKCAPGREPFEESRTAPAVPEPPAAGDQPQPRQTSAEAAAPQQATPTAGPAQPNQGESEQPKPVLLTDANLTATRERFNTMPAEALARQAWVQQRTIEAVAKEPDAQSTRRRKQIRALEGGLELARQTMRARGIEDPTQAPRPRQMTGRGGIGD